MKAGCIANQILEWQKIISNPEILSTVSGLPLDFNGEIDYKESQHKEAGYILPIFSTPKSDGSFRMILNLKKLNDYMPYIHFKMETMKSVLNLITSNCYMAKSVAYYSIPILPEHQKFLKFSLQGKLHKFTCLPNGLCSGPRNLLNYSNPH